MRIYWNDDWGFTKEYSEELLESSFSQESLEKVRIPHTVVVTPYNYFDAEDYQMISGYRKIFTAPIEWQSKHVLITFEGAAQEATVYLNNQQLIVHHCGYTAFTVDMSPYIKFSEENILVVKLDSNETLNQPPFGKVVDYMTYGGIYRDVYIEVKNEIYIQDVYYEIDNVLDKTKMIKVHTCLSGNPEQKILKQRLLDVDGHEVFSFTQTGDDNASYGISTVQLWSPEHPILYQLKTELYMNDELKDEYTIKVGFRKAEFLEDGFYLNGKKRKLRGLNRHQSFPYVGYAMPERVQKRDVDILLDELGVNAVRTSHYPQSHYFMDACDERGLLVFTEIPGWQHLGDEEWKEQALKNVEDMINQYKNHPSIIMWGVRINESMDDDKLYKKTNALAHKLDPSRQTGGVRYLKKSHFYEDVYTYNDFVHSGENEAVTPKKKVTPNAKKGYVITEFNGHMYPTKIFDREEIRLEHALRTARVMNGYYEATDIAGGFGWCMFDYNTHKDFGSGDKICYHGVLDMFRNPKIAAAVYSSQTEGEPILEISSTMDMGEYPAGNIKSVYAFTNAQSVKLYKNDEFVKEFKANQLTGPYKSLPHPPIEIDDFVGELLEKHEKYSHKTCESIKTILRAVQKYGFGAIPFRYKRKMTWLMLTHFISMKRAVELYGKYVGNWGQESIIYRFEAISNYEVVKTVQVSPQSKKVLVVEADTNLLVENHSYDVASIRIQMRDENGILMHYYQEPLKLTTNGVIQLIGPDVISLKGGCFGTYVKTIGESGEGSLLITTNDGETKEIKFNVLA